MSLATAWREVGDAIRGAARDLATVTVTGVCDADGVRSVVAQVSVALDDDVRVAIPAGAACPAALAELLGATTVAAASLHRAKLVALARVLRMFVG